jgi:hypothetical protein
MQNNSLKKKLAGHQPTTGLWVTRDMNDLVRRRDQGFQLLGLSVETDLLISGLQHRLDVLQGDESPDALPMSREPARQRPARPPARRERSDRRSRR